jgi:ABC-type antimicrobial peptide transport system permease subunit
VSPDAWTDQHEQPRVLTAVEERKSRINPTTLESQVSIQFIHLRIASQVLGWGGAFGLLLAAIGIYGIVSVAVTECTREMAIRMAMGAERPQVIRRIAGGGLVPSLVGLLAVLAVVLPLTLLLYPPHTSSHTLRKLPARIFSTSGSEYPQAESPSAT